MTTYKFLKVGITVLHQLRAQFPETPSREQRINWAFGSAVLENPKVTREMVERAVDAADMRTAP